jgi:hypothetical protein
MVLAAQTRQINRADLSEWHAAIEALMLVVDLGAPTMFAQIAVQRALNRHHQTALGPRRKRPKDCRIVR